MNKWIIALLLCALPCAAQVIPNPKKTSSYVAKTSLVLNKNAGIGQVQVASIALPANLLGSNGHLQITTRWGGCITTGNPYQVCNGAGNTGTCTLWTYLASTPTGTTYSLSTNFAVAAQHRAINRSDLVTAGSASVEYEEHEVTDLTSGTVLGSQNTSGTINTAAPFYLNFFMQNSVAPDSCVLAEVLAVATTN